MATASPDGFLLVDKPAGMSSHDVVARVRRARGGIRAGHTGTLDPFATGLLLVALGRATRLIRFVPGEPKVYEATIAFGESTDTDDATGTVTGRGPVPDEGTVQQGIERLTGTLEQVPPSFSARHVDGRRAYAIARNGQQPALAATSVTVERWDVHAFEQGMLAVTITCGAGTYIRALARDLGRLSGTVGHLAALRRTRIGPFDVNDAVAPDESREATPLEPARALATMPRRVLDHDEIEQVRHGRAVTAQDGGGNVALVDAAGSLLAVAERAGEWLQPRVVLAGE